MTGALGEVQEQVECCQSLSPTLLSREASVKTHVKLSVYGVIFLFLLNVTRAGLKNSQFY